jgi:hypothetical protein
MENIPVLTVGGSTNFNGIIENEQDLSRRFAE